MTFQPKSPAEITLEDLAQWAEHQDPNNINPMIGETCVYNGNGTHCIAGQFFADNDTPVPHPNGTSANGTELADAVARKLGYSDKVGRALLSAQYRADRDTFALRRGCTTRPAWKTAIHYLKQAPNA